MRPSSRWCEWWLRMGCIGLMGLCLAVWLAALAPAWTEPQPDAAVQERLKELRQVQERVQAVVKKVTPAVVAVLVNPGQGSGVVVTPDGYVLTAGHVSGKPNREVTVVFPDGKRARGKTLGMHPQMDSGLIKLEGDGPWPHVAMGDVSRMRLGDWVVAIGHPGGFRPGRAPVVRVGRVIRITPQLVQTDCTLVGGDSGGPLFDLDGKVVGIHSRIGSEIAINIHVPVNTYRDTWEALAEGRVLGLAYLGVRGDESAEQAKILEVQPDSPAAKAGLQPNDIILSVDGRKVTDYRSFRSLLQQKRPGEVVRLEVQRGNEKLELKVKLGSLQ